MVAARCFYKQKLAVAFNPYNESAFCVHAVVEIDIKQELLKDQKIK
jgi:hypothetical protein